MVIVGSPSEKPDADWKHKCGDCGRSEGQYHAENCDIERCPKCGGQLLSCDCEFKRVARSGFLLDTKSPFLKRYARFRVGKSIDEDFGITEEDK